MPRKVKIIANEKFKHDTETYAKGKTYEVPADEAEYFIAQGWARDASGKARPDPRDVSLPIRNEGDDVTLAPDDGSVGQSVN